MTDGDQPKIDLNPPALRPVADKPWRDDALQRQGIAVELDKLVTQLASGAEPATIALDGGYGTGKTFILERWVREMHNRDQVAVYYNAWENDCDDDPLVSLIETLSSNDKIGWSERLTRASSEALSGILRKHTGIDAQKAWEAGKDETIGLLEAARSRRESRQSLKDILAERVDATKASEFPGVVVVVDELDRCRPTFATELMERVKHVLNVPGLVFVFGINMATLQETVKAVYGDIDAHQYLLRMFTVTLQMPPGVVFSGSASEQDTTEYLQGLADRYGMRAFCRRETLLAKDLDNALDLLSIVVAAGALTPRESERVMWLLSKVGAASLGSDGRSSAMFPRVLVPLAIARVKKPVAYYQTVSRPNEAPAVINCFFEFISEVNLHEREMDALDELEMTMYLVCHQRSNSEPPAYLALRAFVNDDEASILDSHHLSHRSAGISKERAKALLQVAPPKDPFPERLIWTFKTLRFITSRFDVVWPKS